MQNISGFGLSASVVASVTFPSGFTVTEFPDDADPLNSPDLTAADTAMGLNGDMIVWSRAQGIEIEVNIIPTTDGAINSMALLEANRVGKKKTSARDKVTISITYPDGSTATCSNGVIVSGPPVIGAASSGRLKTQRFVYRFESVSKTNAQ